MLIVPPTARRSTVDIGDPEVNVDLFEDFGVDLLVGEPQLPESSGQTVEVCEIRLSSKPRIVKLPPDEPQGSLFWKLTPGTRFTMSLTVGRGAGDG